jgi:regulatory protein
MFTQQDKDRVYNAAIRLLARREYGVLEISKKLARKHQARLVEEVVSHLVEQNLVSDSRFAESLCNSRRGRGYGPMYIIQELSMRGIGKETILECVDKSESIWLNKAISAGQKKASNILLEKDFFQTEAFEAMYQREKTILAEKASKLSSIADNTTAIGMGEKVFNNSEDGVNLPGHREVAPAVKSAQLYCGETEDGPSLVDSDANSFIQENGKEKRRALEARHLMKKTKDQFYKEIWHKEWTRVAAFLSRRGFPSDLVAKAMGRIAPE